MDEELRLDLTEEEEKSSPKSETRKRIQGGTPSNEIVFSAYVSDNAEVFASAARLHLPEGSLIADLTYGKGVFWRRCPSA